MACRASASDTAFALRFLAMSAHLFQAGVCRSPSPYNFTTAALSTSLSVGSPVCGRLECVRVLESTWLCVELRAHILGVTTSYRVFCSFVTQRSMFRAAYILLGLTCPVCDMSRSCTRLLQQTL